MDNKSDCVNGVAILNVLRCQNTAETRARIIEASVEAMRTGALSPDVPMLCAFAGIVHFGDDAQLVSVAKSGIGFVMDLDPNLHDVLHRINHIARECFGTTLDERRHTFMKEVRATLPVSMPTCTPQRALLTADTLIGRLQGLVFLSLSR